MKILKTYMITVLSALSLSSHAYIFFDDFDGNDLKPYWYVDKGEFNASNWEYTVENSMLNVWNVWAGSGVGIIDIYTISAYQTQKGDFDVRAKMGWDEGQYQSLYFTPYNIAGNIPLYFGYHNRPGSESQIKIFFSNWGGKDASFPAPPAGIYEFRITRIGSILSAYLDDELLFASNSTELKWMGSLGFRMIGPGYNNPDFAPLYVDWVAVIPEPASLACLSTFLAYLFIRRKKNV